jgi:hypothetical protein
MSFNICRGDVPRSTRAAGSGGAWVLVRRVVGGLCVTGCRTAQDVVSADHFFGALTLRIAATHSSQSLSISSCWALSSACCS